MIREKLLKLIFRKFKWKIFFLFFLTFLISYISFLIRFNLVNNLALDRGRGYFFYFFGKYKVIEKNVGNKIFVNWNKLLLILFLLYFPLKIIIHLTLNYWRKNYQKETEILLTKKLLSYADKNRYLIMEKIDEKSHIINDVVPDFSYQFISITIEIFEIFSDTFFILFNLRYLVKFYHLSNLVPLLVIFVLINLIWLTFFYFLFSRLNENNMVTKNNYQYQEKSQIKNWLENLISKNRTCQNPKEINKLLENNYQKTVNINFFSTFYQLPTLMISGTTILFLFFYYHFYCGGKGGLEWSIYFIAGNLQAIIWKIEKGLSLPYAISSLKENYQKIKFFFD